MKQCQSTGILILCHDLSHFTLYILRVLSAVLSSAGSFSVLRFVAGEAPFPAVELTGVAKGLNSGSASNSRKIVFEALYVEVNYHTKVL